MTPSMKKIKELQMSAREALAVGKNLTTMPIKDFLGILDYTAILQEKASETIAFLQRTSARLDHLEKLVLQLQTNRPPQP